MKPRDLPETVYVCESQELEPLDVYPSKLDPENAKLKSRYATCDGLAAVLGIR